jgi:hypothetical protein
MPIRAGPARRRHEALTSQGKGQGTQHANNRQESRVRDGSEEEEDLRGARVRALNR